VSESDANSEKQEVTYFYLPPDHLDGDKCRFSREESHHITSVYRYSRGDVIPAADGAGRLYSVEILEIDDERVMGHVIKERANVNELPIEITVAFGMLAMGKTEGVVDQLTQLGVRRMIPLLSQKNLVKLDKHRLAAKVDRWQRVAVAAMKQSLRCVLPEIYAPMRPAELTNRFERHDSVLLASLQTTEPLRKKNLRTKNRILLIAGPEAGFTADEESLLLSAGAQPISLGSRRLRAELAPIVLTSKLLALI
jgi:16S rRNA (uracil1498-N3)-methyltransferase